MSAAASKKEGSFISPFWDFVFAGGLTFVFLPIYVFFDISPNALAMVAVTMYMLTLVIDNPHLLFSYQLMYKNFSQKIGGKNSIFSRMRYFLSGVIVPVLFVVFFIYSYFHGLGNQNTLMLGYAVNAMFFFAGQHYVKQGYGVLVAFSVKTGCYFSDIEKKILTFNAYAVWISVWMFFNRNPPTELKDYFSIPYSPTYIPFDGSVFVVAATLSSLVVFFFFVRRMVKNKVTWAGWVAYISAVYLWMILAQINSLFILLAPALHSLQYLLFVGKISFEKNRDPVDGKSKGFLGFIATGGILGVLGIWMVPFLLNEIVPYDHDVFGPTMFTVMFVVFISTHHYFIDFAIWRKDNPDMKYLYE